MEDAEVSSKRQRDLDAALLELPVLQTPAAGNAPALLRGRFPPAVLCVDGQQRLLTLELGGRNSSPNLYVSFLWELTGRPAAHAEKPGAGPAQKLLKLDAELHEDASRLVSSPSGRNVAVFGVHSIRVVSLPTPLDPSVPIRSIEVARRLLSQRHTYSVVDVTWSLFSNSHLLVLLSDGCLRLFALEEDTEAPEQTMRVVAAEADESTRASAVCMWVGNTQSGGWDAFAVHVLMSDGAVATLCPVLPHRCVVPGALVTELLVATQRALQLEEQSAQASENWTRMQWLVEIGGARHYASGGRENRLLRTSPPATFCNREIAVRVRRWCDVPQRRKTEPGSTFLDFVRFSGAPGVFVLAREDGCVFVAVDVETCVPQWLRQGEAAVDGGRGLALHTRLDLPLQASDGSSLHMRLLPDAVAAVPRVYVCTAARVFGVEFPFVPELLRFCTRHHGEVLDQTAESELSSMSECFAVSLSKGGDFAQGGRTATNQEGAALIGAVVLHDVLSAQHLLVLKRSIVPCLSILPLVSTPLQLVRPTLAAGPRRREGRSSAGAGDDADVASGEDFKAHVRALLVEKRLSGTVRVPSTVTHSDQSRAADGSLLTLDGLKMLVQATSTLKQFHVRKAVLLASEIASRLKFLEKMSVSQRAEVSLLSGRIEAEKTGFESFSKRLEVVERRQRNLSRRAELVFNLSVEQSKRLSPAERALLSDLEQYSAQIERLQTRFEELRVLERDTVRVAASTREPLRGELPVERLSSLHSAIENEALMIQQNIAAVKRVTTAVEQLDGRMSRMSLSPADEKDHGSSGETRL